MKKLAFILLAGASLLGTAGIALAQGYYGGGYGPGPYYGDRYRERYYDDRRYYRGRGGYAYPTAACYYVYGRRICCPGGFTVQDGVCKPYRGY